MQQVSFDSIGFFSWTKVVYFPFCKAYCIQIEDPFDARVFDYDASGNTLFRSYFIVVYLYNQINMLTENGEEKRKKCDFETTLLEYEFMYQNIAIISRKLYFN